MPIIILALVVLALGTAFPTAGASGGRTRLTPAPQPSAGTLGEDEICEVAVVRHAPQITGTVDGTVSQLLPENVSISGSAIVTGDLRVPGLPTVKVNGSPNYQGTIDDTGADTPTNYRVTVGGQAQLRHVVRRVDPVAMPTVAEPNPPTGTLDLHFTSPGETVGNWADVLNLTLNNDAGLVEVPAGDYGNFRANAGSGFVLGVEGATEPSLYSFQSLVLGGHSSLQVVGPVVVTLGSGLTLNASAGNIEHADWLELNVASGDVNLHGGSTLSAIVTAPNGEVFVNGNSMLCGRVTSDRLRVVGTGVLVCCIDDVEEPPPPPPPPTVIVPYGSPWRYKIFPDGGMEQVPVDWFDPAFDDSTWDIGDGAFGSGGSCAVQQTVKTLWPLFSDVVIRRKFTLPAGVTVLRIAGTVDNDVQIYLNGNLVTDWVIHDDCPMFDDLSFTANPAFYHVGENLLTIRASDRGSQSFLDYRIIINPNP